MAYKLSFWIVMFFMFMHGADVILHVSGAAGYMGVDPDTGDAEQLKEAQASAQQYDTGQGDGSTLFGLYNTLSSPVEDVFNIIFPGREMLIIAGVPWYVVDFFYVGLSIIPGYDLIKFLRGI